MWPCPEAQAYQTQWTGSQWQWVASQCWWPQAQPQRPTSVLASPGQPPQTGSARRVSQRSARSTAVPIPCQRLLICCMVPGYLLVPSLPQFRFPRARSTAQKRCLRKEYTHLAYAAIAPACRSGRPPTSTTGRTKLNVVPTPFSLSTHSRPP